MDATDTEVGVCGRGIFLAGSPHDMQVLNNTIVDTGLSAISLNDPLYDAVLLRSNTIKKSTAWGEVEGNPIHLKVPSSSAPACLIHSKLSNPPKSLPLMVPQFKALRAMVALCESCVIEIFLEDTDTITEALQSLVTVTADASGNWSATLPFALVAGQGLRTTSTSAQFNTIPGMSSGTTTGLSVLYGAVYKVYLPLIDKRH